jgi:hypothetical protein
MFSKRSQIYKPTINHKNIAVKHIIYKDIIKPLITKKPRIIGALYANVK